MTVVAEFTIPPEALPFGETLLSTPGTEIEVERIVPTRESALPFFWVWGEDPAVFVDEAEREPNVANVELLERVEDGALFRAEWAPNAELIRGINRLDATVVEAVGTADRWRFEVRTQDRSAFTDFQDLFEAQGIAIDLIRLYDLAELVEGTHRSVTPEQRETLIAAFRAGYYEDPRETTQAELGERFDVSHRAVSDRLRRGTRNLVGDALVPSGR
ncbi:bacterio-opsin activator domain-containing protein [Halovivax sp.]|uniref:helix-turn-helix domain-containing protein n=1 Tax=Halovivax sp. TaxID=1935978 RepID=UPI0025B7F0D5|nr:helix-turn-helix domain-containing protein [Halovivax sp.]